MNKVNKRAYSQQASAKALTSLMSTKNNGSVESFRQLSTLLITVLLAMTCITLFLGESSTSIGLLVVAIFPLLARLFHMQRADKRLQRLSTNMAPIQKEQAVLAGRTLQLAIVVLTFMVIVAWLADFDRRMTLLYAVTIAVAVLPSGLIGTASQSLAQINRWTRHKIRSAIQAAMSDVTAKVSIVLISLLSQALFHVPLAITAIQMLAIDVLLLAAPLSALRWDPTSDHPTERLFSLKKTSERLAFGALTAILSYASFILFFAQRALSPVRIDPSSQLYAQATSITLFTLVLCQVVNLFMQRADKHDRIFSSQLWNNKKLHIALGISFGLLANMIYNPWINLFFGTGALNLLDISCAVIAAALYTLIRFVHRHSRHHTRHALFRDHDHDTLRKHPKLA